MAIVYARPSPAFVTSRNGSRPGSRSEMAARAHAAMGKVSSTALRAKRTSSRLTSRVGRAALVFGMWLVAFGAPSASAAEGDVRASYAVSFAGVPLANVTLHVALRGSTYAAQVDYQVSGAMRLLSNSAGIASSNGTHNAGHFVPTEFDLDHRSGSRRQKVKLGMTDGVVKTMVVDPPLALDSNQTAIEPKHLVAIVDPLSAFLMGAAKIEGRAQGGVCDRALSIFDGLRRYDVKLEHQGTGTTVQKGLGGSTTICRAVFKPVAGGIGEGDRARSSSPNSNVDQITITFGRTSTMDLYIPVSIQAQTRLGAVSVLLTAFSADSARSADSR
ncbi:hypothetical protein XH96_11820 [Bradyrhizobium sp. CCBAU 51765]|nr:hypothetical protein XH96_11820 [Bradyrhizobium sp. CCBAU 51765]